MHAPRKRSPLLWIAGLLVIGDGLAAVIGCRARRNRGDRERNSAGGRVGRGKPADHPKAADEPAAPS